MDNLSTLRRDIALKEIELADLRSQLAIAESEDRIKRDASRWKWPLAGHDYERYSRQMIVPNMGLKAQQRLKQAKVLIVGAGGLGCPSAAYLAGSGVGTLGLVDGDSVETSNLHRQIAHSNSRVGMSKVESAIAYLKGLNPLVHYEPHITHLSTENAEDIVSRYDFVLDCTDHPTSRYLVSDICVLLGKPLVSASAFQTSGQMLILNHPPREGPCYRCVFPKPPPPDSVLGCGEGGILGPVVGAMGVLQALETIKVITTGQGMKGMLLFGAMGDTPFRSVRIRGKRADCFACGESAELTLEGLRNSMDYVQFCGIREPVKLLSSEQRVSVTDYEKAAAEETQHVLLDVREKEQFELANIPGSVNVPISKFMSLRAESEKPEWLSQLSPDKPVFLVCRVGNDSQIAAKKLMEMGLGENGRLVKDIKGGLQAWKGAIDPSFPFT